MTSLSFRVRVLWIDAKAVAAVEFAIVLPFMLLLYVGGVELSRAMAINVKVTATSHSVADMVSQNTQVSAARMQSILGLLYILRECLPGRILLSSYSPWTEVS